MEFKTKRLAVVTCICMLAACLFALAGCKASATEGMQIGNPEDGASIAIVNDTGKDIEAFYLKSTNAKKYDKEALAQDGLATAGTIVNIRYAADDKTARDLEFITTDGSIYELNALKFAEMEDVSLKLSTSGTSCYLEYTDANTGEHKSVLQSEQIAQNETHAREKADKKAAKAVKAAKKAEKAAEESKKDTEQAKKDAEQAKKDAEQAQKDAEETRKTAEEAAVRQAGEAEEAEGDIGNAAESPSSSSASTPSSGSSSTSTPKSSASTPKKSTSSSSGSTKSPSSSSESKPKQQPKSSGSPAASSGDSGSEDIRCIEL